jgi:hypothetical protein
MATFKRFEEIEAWIHELSAGLNLLWLRKS